MGFKLFVAVFLVLMTIYIADASYKRNKVYKTHACEGRNIKMHCWKDRVLILKADYGRWNASICPYYDDPDMDLNCHQSKAFTKVSKKCNNHRSCSFRADNDFFSDPCPGQIKYSMVYYTCLSMWSMISFNTLSAHEREVTLSQLMP